LACAQKSGINIDSCHLVQPSLQKYNEFIVIQHYYSTVCQPGIPEISTTGKNRAPGRNARFSLFFSAGNGMIEPKLDLPSWGAPAA
ncbi:MAG: hypothetical protein SOV46_06825, partial [Candidatus Faecousia sp.]|nr:hypothetical protein [Candidatus Faecousia sp.]